MTRPQSPPCVYGISPFKIDLLSKLYRFPGASEFEILKDYEQDRDSLTRRCIVRADCVALHVIDISISNPAINCLLTVHRNLSLLQPIFTWSCWSCCEDPRTRQMAPLTGSPSFLTISFIVEITHRLEPTAKDLLRNSFGVNTRLVWVHYKRLILNSCHTMK